MTEQQEQKGSAKGSGVAGCLVAILLLIGVFALAQLLGRANNPQPSSRQTVVRTVEPAAALREVRNSCGACGTDSPVGGWESTNGRTLFLAENGNFSAYFEDDTSMSGTWRLSGDRLCLSPDIGGDTCFDYEQKIDAMRLDDALYIRR